MAADLAAADQQRRELIANVSHELRTPIAALQAVLENLVDGVATADPATLRTALSQTQRLGRLVDRAARPVAARRAARWRCDPAPFPVGRAAGAGDARGRGRARVAARGVAARRRPAAAIAAPRRPRPRCTRCWRTCWTTPPGTARPAGGRWSVAARRDATAGLEVADEGPGIAARGARAGVRALHARRPRGRTAAPGSGLAIARWTVDAARRHDRRRRARRRARLPDPDHAPGGRGVSAEDGRARSGVNRPRARVGAWVGDRATACVGARAADPRRRPDGARPAARVGARVGAARRTRRRPGRYRDGAGVGAATSAAHVTARRRPALPIRPRGRCSATAGRARPGRSRVTCSRASWRSASSSRPPRPRAHGRRLALHRLGRDRDDDHGGLGAPATR